MRPQESYDEDAMRFRAFEICFIVGLILLACFIAWRSFFS